ncbi:hypothetical protein C0J56_13570 [Pseudomonas fluorescens]|nr:hypothetical protein C0J56_13570 [Pseudomonas fluorescens]
MARSATGDGMSEAIIERRRGASYAALEAIGGCFGSAGPARQFGCKTARLAGAVLWVWAAGWPGNVGGSIPPTCGEGDLWEQGLPAMNDNAL